MCFGSAFRVAGPGRADIQDRELSPVFLDPHFVAASPDGDQIFGGQVCGPPHEDTAEEDGAAPACLRD